MSTLTAQDQKNEFSEKTKQILRKHNLLIGILYGVLGIALICMLFVPCFYCDVKDVDLPDEISAPIEERALRLMADDLSKGLEYLEKIDERGIPFSLAANALFSLDELKKAATEEPIHFFGMKDGPSVYLWIKNSVILSILGLFVLIVLCFVRFCGIFYAEQKIRTEYESIRGKQNRRSKITDFSLTAGIFLITIGICLLFEPITVHRGGPSFFFYMSQICGITAGGIILLSVIGLVMFVGEPLIYGMTNRAMAAEHESNDTEDEEQ